MKKTKTHTLWSLIFLIYYCYAEKEIMVREIDRLLIAEATECDFKEAVETSKPKSWLKSVSAFANGIGGTLLFGVADDRSIVGLPDPQADSEFISNKIKERVSPVPEFVLKPYKEKGKTVLALIVQAGNNTPYFYSADGVKQAYVRFGTESMAAPDYMLMELILKGENRTYDALATEFLQKDYSFTLLEATYRERTGLALEESNYSSFGLVAKDNRLTRVGALLADQYIVYNSRIFCTRWNGLEKGSIFDDALDDKEYEGNLIYLLKSGVDFIKNNSKVRFEKIGTGRTEKPDYAERAVFESLVNAIIHRDYITMGVEIHIDMYDDRLEITSPGGMYKGKPIQEQDIERIKSERRNPVLADLFHRMKYMERRGSGLRKIIAATESLPGYSDEFKPEFFSDTSFCVRLKNVNYESGGQTAINADKTPINREQAILDFIDRYGGIANGGNFISCAIWFHPRRG
jgi:ATP-dependent DNA helicase RecG